MAQIFKNNTWGQLASELTAGATTATLSAGHGFTDPGTDWYLATLIGVTGTTETAWEIVKVTDVSTNTLTIVRAQEGTTAATWPAGTRIELRLTAGATESKTNLGNAAYANLLGPNAYFAKSDPTQVAWTKTDNGTAKLNQLLHVEVNGLILIIAADTAITMPSLTAGTDYAIWCKTDGSLEASSNHVTPPAANARRIGGFHYAPGGNASAQAGGDSTPAINPYSFWDLHWRFAGPDPRGMALVAGGFWADIYLLNTDPDLNGTSAHGVTIADGSSPPKIPAVFGGSGGTTYGSLTWFEAQEVLAAYGKRAPTQAEFMALAYGVTEATSRGSDPGTTGLDAARTSRWGIMQATGNLWVWGRDLGGAYSTAGWSANTEGRGSTYNGPNAALFGADWSLGEYAGSRASDWHYAPSLSSTSFGARGVGDHLQLV